MIEELTENPRNVFIPLLASDSRTRTPTHYTDIFAAFCPREFCSAFFRFWRSFNGNDASKRPGERKERRPNEGGGAEEKKKERRGRWWRNGGEEEEKMRGGGGIGGKNI